MTHAWLPRIAALAALALPALAQGEFTFNINQSQSNFTWTGTSTLGPIVGNPSNAFQLAGTTGMRMFPLANDAIAQADFPGTGDAAVVPNIRGKINNPLPFLPPLATVAIDNLHLKLTAPQFPVAANGAFTATVTMTYISGTMTTVSGGQTTVTDLTGQQSSPSPQNGTLTQTGTTLFLVMPVNATSPFSDPTSGVSGSITINGTVRASWALPAAGTYCTAKVNSLGCTPAIAFAGTPSWTNGLPFVVSASNVLSQKTGLAFYGYAPSSAAFQGGFKCVAPPTFRTLSQNSGGSASGADCAGSYGFDFNALIRSQIDPGLLPGRKVFVQIWSRDPASSSLTGLTNAVQFTIAP
ncbi:MAG: hypothetical protein FJ298_13940 [Planctomycetes bacterium]|nr:hypothetical protein [Planctomycetota bacterium]